MIIENPVADFLRVNIGIPGTGAFVLGTSRLGSTDRLSVADQSIDLAPALVQSLVINRVRGQVSTAALTLKGDPSDHHLRVGQRIMFNIATSSTIRIFTALIRSFTQTWHYTAAGPVQLTTIACSDVFTELANQTRYGAATTGNNPDTFLERAARLLRSAPDLPYTINTNNPQTTYPSADSVHETSLANWLQLTCDSSPTANWWIDRDGVISVRAGNPVSLGTVLTPEQAQPGTNRLTYVDIDVDYDTAAIINELEIINHRRQQDEQGQWVALDEATVHVDHTSRATFGAVRQTIDVCLDDPADVQTLATHILTTRSTPQPTVRRVRINAQANLALAALLDVSRTIYIQAPHFDLPDAYYLITAITHEFTGARWMTTLTVERP